MNNYCLLLCIVISMVCVSCKKESNAGCRLSSYGETGSEHLVYYDHNGRMMKVANYNQVDSFSYNQDGNLAEIIRFAHTHIGIVNLGNIKMTYSAGQLTSYITYQLGRNGYSFYKSAQFDYDSIGRISMIEFIINSSTTSNLYSKDTVFNYYKYSIIGAVDYVRTIKNQNGIADTVLVEYEYGTARSPYADFPVPYLEDVKSEYAITKKGAVLFDYEYNHCDMPVTMHSIDLSGNETTERLIRFVY